MRQDTRVVSEPHQPQQQQHRERDRQEQSYSESVTFAVKQALEKHAEYLEAQMELIRTSFGTTTATIAIEEEDDDDDDDDDDSLSAEEKLLAEDERSIHNDLEKLMRSIRSNSEAIHKKQWIEMEDTVTGTFSESSSSADQFLLEEEEEDDDDSRARLYSSSTKNLELNKPMFFQVVASSSSLTETETVIEESECSEVKATPRLPGEPIKEATSRQLILVQTKESDASASTPSPKPKPRVTFQEDSLHNETPTNNNSPQIESNQIVLDLSALKDARQKHRQKETKAEFADRRSNNEQQQEQQHSLSSADDDASILEYLEHLVESLKSLSTEEFLREFDDRSQDGDDDALPDTKQGRVNFFIHLLGAKAQDMYSEGQGLDIIYASAWLAARLHAQRSHVLGTMLPNWFRGVLHSLTNDPKLKELPSWALAPTIGSASGNGHFMPLCDFDDYHEQDPMLSDLEDYIDEDEGREK